MVSKKRQYVSNRLMFGTKEYDILIAPIHNSSDNNEDFFDKDGAALHEIDSIMKIQCDVCGNKLVGSPGDRNAMGRYNVKCPICGSHILTFDAYHIYTN